MLKKSLIITFFCLLVDQISKIIIATNLKLNSGINIISNFFSLTYVENDGAAWSIFSGNTIFLIMISIIALILVYIYFIKNQNMKKIEYICYSILIGGIIGNLIDRIRLGYVIDFIDFKIFGYNFPVFNLADTFIVISIFILLIYSIKDGVKNERNSC